MGFDPKNHALNIQESFWDSNSQHGSSLGSVRVHSLTLFALLGTWKMTFGSPFWPATLQPPCLDREPKARIATKDLCDLKGKAWKSLQALRMTYHATNMNNRKIIIVSIPWNLATYTNCFQAGDWINKRVSENNTTLAWVYHVIGVTPTRCKPLNSRGSPPLVSLELRTPRW